MRAVALVAGVELRRRLRNRSAIFTAVIGPLALAVVFGVLIGGAKGSAFVIGVVDQDHGAITQPFTQGLAASANAHLKVVQLDSREAAVRAIDRQDIGAAIIVPAGFGTSVTGGAAAHLEVLRDPRNVVTGGLAASIAGRFAASLESRSLAVATSMSLGGATPSAAQLAGMRDTVSTAIVDASPGGRAAAAAPFFGASMSILFLFFTVSFAARSLIEERRNGLVPRMLAASTSTQSIVAGKVIAVSLLGLAGFATVWGATSLLFHDSWGNPLGVLAVMVATVAAVAAIASTVCGLARTAEQAEGYNSAAAFAFALLGGNFVGPGSAPPGLRRVAGFTPNGQALDAFTRLSADGVGIGGIWHQLVALLAFTVVFGVLARVTLARSARRGGR